MSFSVAGRWYLGRVFAGRGTIRQTAPVRRAPVGLSGDATLRFGAESRFEILEGRAVTQPIFINLPQGDEQDDENPIDEGLRYVETNRVTSTVRVVNPNDAGDFVDVERIEEITFQRPDGRLVTFVLQN